jgi:hypothetical protein
MDDRSAGKGTRTRPLKDAQALLPLAFAISDENRRMVGYGPEDSDGQVVYSN